MEKKNTHTYACSYMHTCMQTRIHRAMRVIKGMRFNMEIVTLLLSSLIAH